MSAGGVALLVTMILVCRHQLSLPQWVQAGWTGVQAVVPAMTILICAWMLVAIMSDLGTGAYLASLAQGIMQPAWLPMLMFILAGIIAFATGTSWGTFGLMLPIAGEMAATMATGILLPTLAAVLAGAVFGDHCSLISDTTIMSSTGAACHVIDHVWTQLPYALTVAGICALSYVVVGLSGSGIAGLLTGMTALAAILGFFLRLSRMDGAHVAHKSSIKPPRR